MENLKISVLIVEDEFAYADTLEGLLEEIGCYVMGIAESYEQALYYIDKEVPDLILMDIAIKGKMNGIELAEYIYKEIQNIPIIFITAYADDKTFNKAKLIGAHSFITKPFDNITLKRNIEMAVSKISSEINIFNESGVGILAKDFLFIKDKGIIKKVRIDDISIISLEDKYSIIYAHKRKYAVRKTLKEISHLLNPSIFTQVHRSHIINTHKIDSISLSAYEINLDNQKIPIGRTYKDQLVSRIQVI
jgi:DNA-binding LytR/AlgR family response regulator